MSLIIGITKEQFIDHYIERYRLIKSEHPNVYYDDEHDNIITLFDTLTWK
jgi:hypothetical protein